MINNDPILLTTEQLRDHVEEIACKIKAESHYVCVWILLHSGFVFGADLLRQLDMPVRTAFLHIDRGYTSGKPHKPRLRYAHPKFDPKYEHIFLDVVCETGQTLQFAKSLIPPGPVREQAKLCSLVVRILPDNPKYPLPDYYGLKTSVPGFLTGYGMAPHRHWPDVRILPKREKKP